jgi:5-methylthioadenosine/S-adenosylhomocysteine deaminase
MIEAAAALAQEHDTRWYMHLAESESAAAGVGGTRALQLLEDWGVLDDRLVGVHAVWLSDDELDRLGAVRGNVSYNPASNLFFGERIIDLAGYKGRGINVAIGTDSSASNNAQDVFSDVRLAALSQRLGKRDPAAVSDREMLDLATADGGTVTGLPIGRLAPGHHADFLVLDLDQLSLLPRDRLAANLVYAMDPRAIRHVYVDGRAVVRDGTLANVDLAQVVDRIDAAARRR